MDCLIRVQDVTKEYRIGGNTFPALRGVSLQIQPGEFTAIMGPSGSGKSTLLHLLGGLDKPTTGTIDIAGQSLHKMNETGLALFRRKHVGFVFQFFNLVTNLTIKDNIELPALLESSPLRARDVAHRAAALMERLNISSQAAKLPAQLSGGQRQRAAIARALMNNPSLLLADEPTGNLDSAAGSEVLRLFQELHAQGQTILLVTHDAHAAACAARVIFIRDGLICGDESGLSESAIALHLSTLSHQSTPS